MMKPPNFAGILGALLLAGCATGLGAAPAQQADSREYPDRYDVIWRRILEGSARHSMQVTKLDRANGLINAAREITAPTDGGTIFDWADCGWNQGIERPLAQRAELNYVLRPQASGARLTVNARFAELRQNLATRKVHWADCPSTGVLEKQMLESFFLD